MVGIPSTVPPIRDAGERRKRGTMHDHGFECPACGHMLSAFEEPPPTPAERAAAAVADRVATWWFACAVIAFLVVWISINVAWRPFEPYPVVVLAVVSAVLAAVAALQGPLILVTQRRAAERDRARDREALRVAMNAEADIHRVETKLGEMTELFRDAR
jgi:uncharacterized membrane protein